MSTTLHYPTHYAHFACKLGACRRTCCDTNDWSISMSADEFERAAAADTPCAPTLARECVRDANGAHDEAIGLPTRQDGKCALLADDGTCQWRNDTGCDLCAICHDFPLSEIKIGDDIWAIPSGGCEAVLESLAQDGRIEFAEQAACESRGAAQRGFKIEIAADELAEHPICAEYGKFVQMGADILQMEGYSLDQRVGVLLSFLNAADAMAKAGQAHALPAAIEGMADKRRIDAIARTIPLHEEKSPAPMLCGNALGKSLQSPGFRDFSRAVLTSLGLDAPQKGRGRSIMLKDPVKLEGARRAMHGIARQNEGFLARCTLCLYLQNLTPIAGPDIWSCSKYFALCYALMKMCIAGNAEAANTADGIVDTLVVVLRAFAHNEGFYHNEIRWMDATGFDSLQDTLALVAW